MKRAAKKRLEVKPEIVRNLIRPLTGTALERVNGGGSMRPECLTDPSGTVPTHDNGN